MAIDLGHVRRWSQREQRKTTRAKRSAERARSSMTHTELKAIRHGLGLTVAELARVCVISEPLLIKLMQGSRRITVIVEGRIRDATDEVWRYRKRLETAISGLESWEETAVPWYGSADDIDGIGRAELLGAYRQTVGQLCARDRRVRLVPFDGEDYQRWLKGRPDSQALRFAWAAQHDSAN